MALIDFDSLQSWIEKESATEQADGIQKTGLVAHQELAGRVRSYSEIIGDVLNEFRLGRYYFV